MLKDKVGRFAEVAWGGWGGWARLRAVRLQASQKGGGGRISTKTTRRAMHSQHKTKMHFPKQRQPKAKPKKES